MIKCPACGYEFGGLRVPDDEYIRQLMESRSESVKNTLRVIIRLIRTNVPSDNESDSVNLFLQSISKCRDNVIKSTCNRYVSRGDAFDGKGFRYLSKMILTTEKDSKVVSKNEKKRYGTSPPIIKIKENE
tara:strand:+ start:656 stop:1045 length:390 start_codon:yes stop_codon:yes gene_type:complete